MSDDAEEKRYVAQFVVVPSDEAKKVALAQLAEDDDTAPLPDRLSTLTLTKQTRSLNVGHVYSFELIERGDVRSFVLGSRKWLRESMHADVARWQARALAADAAARARVLEKKLATAHSSLLPALDELRRARIACRLADMPAFDTFVLTSIRRGLK